MKIEFKNGSSIETLECDIVRSTRGASANNDKRVCCVLVRDSYTDNIIDGGYFKFDEIIELEEDGYVVEFESDFDIKAYEHYKSMKDLDKTLQYLGSDEWINDTVEKYFKEER